MQPSPLWCSSGPRLAGVDANGRVTGCWTRPFAFLRPKVTGPVMPEAGVTCQADNGTNRRSLRHGLRSFSEDCLTCGGRLVRTGALARESSSPERGPWRNLGAQAPGRSREQGAARVTPGCFHVGSPFGLGTARDECPKRRPALRISLPTGGSLGG